MVSTAALGAVSTAELGVVFTAELGAVVEAELSASVELDSAAAGCAVIRPSLFDIETPFLWGGLGVKLGPWPLGLTVRTTNLHRPRYDLSH